MPEQPKLVTQPHNPFLLEAFRAFTSEGLPMPIAADMVNAHVAHAHAKVEVDQALALVRIADSLEQSPPILRAIESHLATINAHLSKLANMTDPVTFGRFLAVLCAGMAKRAEKTSEREAADVARLFGNLFGMSDEELSS